MQNQWNKIITNKSPRSHCEYISPHSPNLELLVATLIKQRCCIEYSWHGIPDLPAALNAELGEGRYLEFVLESDHDRRFLVPKGAVI